MTQIKDFRVARRNANGHTQRGTGMLDRSIREDGWIGAMTTAADREMISGSARIECAADIFGTELEPLVIETDGKRPVIIVRTDIATASDPRAQRLALADNRIAQLDLGWDIKVLATLDALTLDGLFTVQELEDFGKSWGPPPSLDTLIDRHGEPGEQDFWPIIKVRVSPTTKMKYDQLMETLPGADEAEKFDALVSSCG
jgi:hypothetical protein